MLSNQMPLVVKTVRNHSDVLMTSQTSAIIKQAQKIKIKHNASVIMVLISMRDLYFLIKIIRKITLANVMHIISQKMVNVSKNAKMVSIKTVILTVSVRD